MDAMESVAASSSMNNIAAVSAVPRLTIASDCRLRSRGTYQAQLAGPMVYLDDIRSSGFSVCFENSLESVLAPFVCIDVGEKFDRSFASLDEFDEGQVPFDPYLRQHVAEQHRRLSLRARVLKLPLASHRLPLTLEDAKTAGTTESPHLKRTAFSARQSEQWSRLRQRLTATTAALSVAIDLDEP